MKGPMKRRNFFALLFAPLVARLAPKPRIPSADTIDAMTAELQRPVKIAYSYVTGPDRYYTFTTSGNEVLSSGYRLGKPPIMFLDQQPPYPWTFLDAAQDHHQA